MRLTDPQVKNKARDLRKSGHSLSEISAIIARPANSISGWVKDITLTSDQIIRLKNKERECGKRGLDKVLVIRREKLSAWKKDVESRTIKYASFLDRKSDLAKLLCGALYLCEGAKYPATKHLVFGNSDPRMIKIFLELLRNNFHIDENKFRCRIMLRHDQVEDPLERFWSDLTNIPLSQFYRSYKDQRTKGKTTKNKEYRGICAVQYLSADLQYELQLIGESIYELVK